MPRLVSAIDLILAHPFMKCCCSNPKLHGSERTGAAVSARHLTALEWTSYSSNPSSDSISASPSVALLTTRSRGSASVPRLSALVTRSKG